MAVKSGAAIPDSSEGAKVDVINKTRAAMTAPDKSAPPAARRDVPGSERAKRASDRVVAVDETMPPASAAIVIPVRAPKIWVTM